MSEKRTNSRLKFNIIASSTYQLISTIVPIITTPYITRIFSLEQIGSYNLTYSIVVFASLISKFGIDTYGVREISQAKSLESRDKIYFELFSIQLLTSLILFFICNLIFFFLFDNLSVSLTVIQSTLILVNIFDISWFFIGIEEISKTIIRNLITKILSTVLIFTLVHNVNQLNLYASINIIGIFLGNFVMIWSSFNFVNYKKMKIYLSLTHLKRSFKLFVPKILNNSFNTIDRSIVQYLSSIESVGLYSEAQKFIKMLFSVIEQAFNAISPRMSYYISKNEYSKVTAIFKNGLVYCTIFSTIAISGILGISDYFVDFFYGEGYEGISGVLNILSIALLFVPINGLITSGIIIPLSKDNTYRNSTIVMISTGVLAMLVLVPFYGAKGAALSYVVSQASMCIYLIWVIRGIVNIKVILKGVIKIVLYVLLNVKLVYFIRSRIIIDNSIIAFLLFGVISVFINFVLITLFEKNNNKTQNI